MQTEPWSRGDYVPFLYSDAAVEAVVETRIALRPAPAAGPTPHSEA